MNVITLEPIVPAHKELVYHIFLDIHPELTGIEGTAGDQAEWILRLQFEIRQEQLRQLYPDAERNLIILDGVAAGFIYTDLGSDIRIIEVGLFEKYRRKGIGSYVINNIIDKANNLGKNISLQVLWCNKAAYQFYEKLGFSFVRNNDVTYEMLYRHNTENQVFHHG